MKTEVRAVKTSFLLTFSWMVNISLENIGDINLIFDFMKNVMSIEEK